MALLFLGGIDALHILDTPALTGPSPCGAGLSETSAPEQHPMTWLIKALCFWAVVVTGVIIGRMLYGSFMFLAWYGMLGLALYCIYATGRIR